MELNRFPDVVWHLSSLWIILSENKFKNFQTKVAEMLSQISALKTPLE